MWFPLLIQACADHGPGDAYVASGDDSDAGEPTDSAAVDDDGDGWSPPEDCNDDDEQVHPNSTEICDGVDNDCDGTVDGASSVDASTWYRDQDEDGYGDRDVEKIDCSSPDGYVSQSGDCDDTVAIVNPGMMEICGDGYDNDCDETDNGCGTDASVELAYDADVTIKMDVWSSLMGWVGDTDGDGYDDAVITHGTAYTCFLVPGPITPSISIESDAQSISECGREPGDQISQPSDLDGDGYFDLAVPYGDPDDVTISAAILFGPIDSGTLVDLADIKYDDPFFGVHDIDVVGDIDDDGFVDTVRGNESLGTDQSGAVWIDFDALDDSADDDALRLQGADIGEYFGSSIAGLGDFDGDGVDDLLIGAAGDWHSGDLSSGAAYIFLGPVSARTSDDASWALLGRGENSFFGSEAENAGDLDGDGLADALIGSLGSTTSLETPTRVVAILGRADPLGTVMASDVADYTFGSDVALDTPSPPGNFNQDGSLDIAVSGYWSGLTFLFLGPFEAGATYDESDARSTIEAPTNQMIAYPSLAGDANGDGIADLTVSSSMIGWQFVLYGGLGR
jgi:hypothetical protein